MVNLCCTKKIQLQQNLGEHCKLYLQTAREWKWVPGGMICSIPPRPQWLRQCCWDLFVRCIINQCGKEPRALGWCHLFFYNINRCGWGCSTHTPPCWGWCLAMLQETIQWCPKILTRDISPYIWSTAGSQGTVRWDSFKAPEETSLQTSNKPHPFICISIAL